MTATRATVMAWLMILALGAAPLAAHEIVIDPRPPVPPKHDPHPDDDDANRPLVQIAILLDTSGSMSGLIEQAKAHLWQIVNRFIDCHRGGKRPHLEVALYEYGKSSISASEGYLRMILPLTDDLDRVSEELFALRTNGGQEYCGMVIESAVQGLRWSRSHNDYKAIFIAGNEPFTQGSVDYRDACRAAIRKGVIVNTIFCGPFQTGVDTNWKHGARLADGSYTNIDHNLRVQPIHTPHDDILLQLNVELNATYVPYGRHGAAGRANQAAQDSNSMAMMPAARARTKASRLYTNEFWDLVDADRQRIVKLEELAAGDLPETMKGMSPAERRAYVEKMAEKRVAIQLKIKEVSKQRRTYLSRQVKHPASVQTLEAVMIKAVTEQAQRNGFVFTE